MSVPVPSTLKNMITKITIRYSAPACLLIAEPVAAESDPDNASTEIDAKWMVQ